MNKHKITTLPNKLRVVVDQMKDVETASIAVFVKTGSRNENEANNGISHFLEHMAFKGTKTRNAKEIAEAFDDIGGKINAYTSRDRTVYYVKVLKQDLEFATEFLADILQNSTFDKKELEKERGVILQEIAMTNDTPDDIVFDYFQETAFPNQPLGRSILGPEANIKKFGRSDFTNYIKKQYNYQDMAVVAAGNVDEKKFTSYVKKYFNNLGTSTSKKPQESKYQGGDYRKEKDLEQIHMLLGFENVSYLNKDFYKAQILGSILGGGMSSRLFQEVREKRGLAYSVYAFNYFHADSGLFGVYGGTSKDKANQFLEVVGDELLKATNKIHQTELKRAITQSKANLLMMQESTNSRSQKLGNNILSYSRVIDSDEIIREIESITKKDLTNFATKIIHSSKPTFAAIGNVSGVIDYEKISKRFN